MKKEKMLSLLLCLVMLLGICVPATAEKVTITDPFVGKITVDIPYYKDFYITKNPSKMTYKVGESFDISGIEIAGKLVYDVSGNVKENPLGTGVITGWSPTKFTAAGSQKVTLNAQLKSMTGSYKTFSTSLTVTVKEEATKLDPPMILLPDPPKIASKPTVTKHPGDEHLTEGGSCSFVARADDDESISWTFVSPSGKNYSVSKTKKEFPNLKLSGTTSEKIRLTNVPQKMNGWKIFATFKNEAGSVDTQKAVISVNAAKATATPTEKPTVVSVTPAPTVIPTPKPTVTPDPTPEPTPEPTPHIHKYDTALWMTDADTHWHDCDCGDKDGTAVHDFDWAVTKKATKNAPGTEVGLCKVCGYTTHRTVEYAGPDPVIPVLIAVTVLLVVALVVVGVLLKKNARMRRHHKKHHRDDDR
ncbi:MAG: hypothetical protein Q4C53_00175 [Clostridia bacterium]|nr:hypothetical protein [Clostridia bacterium]